jgi:hypothetical protein
MILDELNKRLYDENSKKGGKWITELPHVVGGYGLNLPKPQGIHLSFSSMDQKQSFLQTSCENVQE